MTATNAHGDWGRKTSDRLGEWEKAQSETQNNEAKCGMEQVEKNEEGKKRRFFSYSDESIALKKDCHRRQ